MPQHSSRGAGLHGQHAPPALLLLPPHHGMPTIGTDTFLSSPLQTPKKLYLVLDFINGGHLFFQVRAAGHKQRTVVCTCVLMAASPKPAAAALHRRAAAWLVFSTNMQHDQCPARSVLPPALPYRSCTARAPLTSPWPGCTPRRLCWASHTSTHWALCTGLWAGGRVGGWVGSAPPCPCTCPRGAAWTRRVLVHRAWRWSPLGALGANILGLWHIAPPRLLPAGISSQRTCCWMGRATFASPISGWVSGRGYGLVWFRGGGKSLWAGLVCCPLLDGSRGLSHSLFRLALTCCCVLLCPDASCRVLLCPGAASCCVLLPPAASCCLLLLQPRPTSATASTSAPTASLAPWSTWWVGEGCPGGEGGACLPAPPPALPACLGGWESRT